MIKLEITTHSGNTDTVEVDEYCPKDIEERLNSIDIQAIAFGKNVYSKIDIKNIRKIEETDDT